MWIILAAPAPSPPPRPFSKSKAEGAGETIGVRPWDSRPNYKIMSEDFLQLPHRPHQPHYPEALALNTSPTPPKKDDTTSSVGSCQPKVFLQHEPLIFFFLLPTRLPECFKVAPRFSEQCRLKGGGGDMTARRNSECHSWHIPHPFWRVSSLFLDNWLILTAYIGYFIWKRILRLNVNELEFLSVLLLQAASFEHFSK